MAGGMRTAARRIRTFTGIAVAASFGALIGYLFDPDRGKARRAKLKDQTAARIRDGVDQARATAEYQKGVAKGVIHKVTEPLRPTREIDGETLLQKVRSEALGQWKTTVQSPGEVEVVLGVDSGQVVLSGTAANEDDHKHLVNLVEGVSGVDSVDDRVTVGPSTK